jgi:hypothetical protein
MRLSFSVVLPLESCICWRTIASRWLEMRRQRILHEVRHSEMSLFVQYSFVEVRFFKGNKTILYIVGSFGLATLIVRLMSGVAGEPRSRYDRS